MNTLSTLRRRAFSRFSLSVVTACALANGAFAQHTGGFNDFLLDALRMDLDSRVSTVTTTYTTEVGEAAAPVRTAWFAWTAPENPPALVRFSTYGSTFDTVIALYKKNIVTAPPPSLVSSLTVVAPAAAPENLVVTDDDAALPAITTGYITWVPQAGITYFISVGRNGGGGATTLETTFGAVTASDAVTAIVPNDNVASALQFTATVTLPLVQRVIGTPALATTIAATAELGEEAIGAATAPRGGSVWYRYTTGAAPEVFSVVITDSPGLVAGELFLQAFINTVAPATPTFVQLTFQEEDTVSSLYGTPRVVINGAANTEYFFRVTSNDGDGALFKIQLDYTATVPANDLIVGAIALSPALPSLRIQGENNYSATAADAIPGFTSGANVWYSWKAPANGLVKIRAVSPSATSTTGNFNPLGSTFRFDAEVYFDSTNPTDTIFTTATAQQVANFTNGTFPQERIFYAVKDIVYFIEIGGDNNINNAGRGFFAFAIEDARITDVARTGVSYGPEGVLKTIGLPVINRNGDISFPATFELGGLVTAANNAGILFYNGVNTRAVVTRGQQEFLTPLDIDGDGINDDKILFSTFTDLFLADRTIAGDLNADIGFTATLSGKSDDAPLVTANSKAFYHDDPAVVGTREFRLTDYVNDSLTWNDGGGFLGAFNTPVRQATSLPFPAAALASLNSVIVTGKMSGIPVIRDTAVFASITPRVVIQEEDPAPNTPVVTDPLLNTGVGAEFGDIAGIPSVNSVESLAFRGMLRGSGVSSTNDTAIYSVSDYNATPTSLNYRLRLREGLTAPAAAGTTLAGGATLFTLGEPRLNTRNKLAAVVSFKIGSGAPAISALNDTAIVSDLVSTDQSFAIVAREGDIVRDAVGISIVGVKFASFSVPVLISGNAVIFTAKVSGTGVSAANDIGIWIWDGYSCYLVAREGAAAPGVLPVGPIFKTLGAPLANPNGRVAFTAVLSGTGISKTNDAGLWTVSEDGVSPLLRLRKGELYNFGRTELPFYRSITSIALIPGSAGDDGFARAMDQDGNVAVLVGLGKAGLPYGQAVLKISP